MVTHIIGYTRCFICGTRIIQVLLAKKYEYSAMSTTDASDWSKEKTLELMELYRERPVLWDCRLSEYKNKNIRQDALTKPANHF